MPAQTEEGQIPVPIFRMLGSDPIYQYDDGLGQERQGVISLEPVYEKAGMDRRWVDYFLESIGLVWPSITRKRDRRTLSRGVI